MSKIIEKSFDHVINYGNNKINLFKKEVLSIEKKDNLEIVKKIIINAKESIFIASTAELDSKISGELQKAIDLGIRVYIINNNFQKIVKTLSVYGKKALIREVKELDNNFIVVDKDNSLLFFDNLFNIKDNELIELDDKESNDLFYWGTYYFWMKSSLEMIAGKSQNIQEGAFHIPKDIVKENINLDSINKKKFNNIFLPLSKKSKEIYHNYNYDNLYLNPNSKNKLFFNKKYTILGNIRINKNLEKNISERWKLYEDVRLIDIDYKVIPFQEDWNKKSIIKIQDKKELTLKSMEAKTIEDMDNTVPSFPKENYIREINYKWTVIPPKLDKKAKKSKYYKEWNDLQSDFDKKLRFLKNIADNMANGEGVKEKFKGFFTGKKRKMKEALNTIEKYEAIELSKINKDEVNKFLNKEFNDFYYSIINSQKEYKEEIDKREQEDIFNEEKKKVKNKIFDINEKIIGTEEKYRKEQKELEEKIKEVENKILLEAKEKLMKEKLEKEKEKLKIKENKEVK